MAMIVMPLLIDTLEQRVGVVEQHPRPLPLARFVPSSTKLPAGENQR
jgi:hypothetical protein